MVRISKSTSIGVGSLASLLVIATSALHAPAANYQSPQEVQAAARAAIVSNDSQALAECLTPDSMEMWAWAAATMTMLAREKLAKDGDAAKAEILEASLAENGLPLSKVKLTTVKLLVTEMHQRKSVIHDAVRTIEHKPRFAAAVCASLLDNFPDFGKAELAEKFRAFNPVYVCQFMNADIVDFQMREQDARAYVEQSHDGKTIPRSLQFRKTANGWLIHHRMDMGRWREPAEERIGFDTPLQAYRFACAYHHEGNLDELGRSLTPTSFSRVTAMVLAQTRVQLGLWEAEGKDPEKFQTIRDNAHRLFELHHAPIDRLSESGTQPEDIELVRSTVPDVPALLCDLLDEAKLGAESKGVPWKETLKPTFSGDLSNIEESDGRATGVVTAVFNGKRVPGQLSFRNIDGGWLLDLQ